MSGLEQRLDVMTTGETFVIFLFIFGIVLILSSLFMISIESEGGFLALFVGVFFTLTTLTPFIHIYEKAGERLEGTVGSNVGDSLDEFERAYVAYYAYEDREFDDAELVLFKGIVSEDLYESMGSGELEGSDVVAYEKVVNELIDEADPSEEKLAFKEYVVVDRGQDILENMWVDEKLDDREAQLVEFAGELVGDSVGAEKILISLRFEGTAKEAFIRNGLSEYSTVLAKLRKKYDRFEVSDIDEEGTDSFYKVTE